MDFAMDNDLDLELLSLKRHAEWKGKVGTEVKVPVRAKSELNMAFVPGCVEPCLEIEYDDKAAFAYTGRGNKVAVISDGSAVLNLGNIGAVASLPYLEGKCAVFKAAAGIDAVPLCIEEKDDESFVRTVAAISKNFGAINLAGIEREKGYRIEKELSEKCGIPVWADQDAFAITVCAGIINGAKLSGKEPDKMLTYVKLSDADYHALTSMVNAMNLGTITTDLNDVSRADLFVDINGDAEGLNKAQTAHVTAILGLPDQRASMLAFPGIFKGLLDARCKVIDDTMKEAAARAIASVLYDDEICEEELLPGIFEKEVIDAISAAIVDTYGKEGLKDNV